MAPMRLLKQLSLPYAIIAEGMAIGNLVCFIHPLPVICSDLLVTRDSGS